MPIMFFDGTKVSNTCESLQLTLDIQIFEYDFHIFEGFKR